MWNQGFFSLGLLMGSFFFKSLSGVAGQAIIYTTATFDVDISATCGEQQGFFLCLSLME